MRRRTIALPGREYELRIEREILNRAGECCRAVLPRARRAALVTDSNVGPRYARRVEESLRAAGFAVKTVTLPAGESTKCPAQLEALWDAFAAFGLTRTDAVAALGGGVVGDLAGFAAATMLRGVDFVQLPTTLLAQVDSSVGGKVAVDLRAGKNLAGAFWQPKLVLMDPDVLETLPDAVFSDGMAEVIKYGCIRDEAFFRRLERCGGRAGVMAEIEDVLDTCCAIKAQVVVEDERDTGARMILNFGHTLGHAYEKAYHYETYTHGQAIAAGMCRAAELGVRLGVTPPEVPAQVSALVRQYGLPEQISCSMADYASAVGLDKKNAGGKINLIVLKALGESTWLPLEPAELLRLVGEAAK